jgi:hypothetical protein
MFRGRVGYDAVGNRQMREKTLLKKREEHLSKIAKIMTRRPAESVTGVSLPRLETRIDPRKRAVQQIRNAMTERENKALLKRISNILTAPPKITDEDYLRMKSLVSSVRGNGPKQSFERRLDDKRMKAFFDNLAKTGAYYNPREWETDYQKQLLKQRFIRQVTYQRPKGFVDRFEDKAAADDKVEGGDRHHPERAASHLSRIRGLRNSRASPAPRHHDNDPGANADAETNPTYDLYADLFEPGEGSSIVLNVKRFVNVTDSDDQVSLQVTMDIRCLLVEGDAFVISAVSDDDDDGQGVSAEAEIGLAELFQLRGSAHAELSEDVKADLGYLRVLAVELVNTLELRIEEGVARLVLNVDAAPIEQQEEYYDQNEFS